MTRDIVPWKMTTRALNRREEDDTQPDSDSHPRVSARVLDFIDYLTSYYSHLA